MKRFRIGIIGYGGFGRFLHQAWKDSPELEVTAIADHRASALVDLAGVRTCADWRELLHLPDVDAVAIVTEPSMHEEMATELIRAGKPVLIEKPLAQDSASARRILSLRDEMGGIAAADLIMRFNPLLRDLRQLTAEGIFGTLRRVDVENYAQDESLPSWFWDKERSGGILVEHAVHFIDLVHFLQPGRVIAVNGMTHHRNAEQEDQVMANILYAGGLMATHYHSFARPGFFENTRIRLAYDLADIDLEGWIPLAGKISVLTNPERRARLESFPWFVAGCVTPVDRVADDSRPEGWGAQEGNGVSTRRQVRSGGVAYEVAALTQGEIDLGRTKLDVYAECVRESMLDLCRRIDSPDHILAAPLEAAYEGLVLGEQAVSSVRKAG